MADGRPARTRRRVDRADGGAGRAGDGRAPRKKQVLDLTAKGFAGTVFLTTEDCQATYEELKARGVEFTEEPHEMPYGIDCGFRDPSGNSVRLTQLAEIPANTG